MTNNPTNPDDQKGLSRRQFLKNSGLVAGGVVGGSLFGGLITNQFQKPAVKNQSAEPNLTEARMYFSRRGDFDLLSAATERLFPKDKNGPGAIELGVPYFIDKQLAGPWGINAKEYTRGPFIQTERALVDLRTPQDKTGPNTETQIPVPSTRYQTKLRRNEVIMQGLRSMDSIAQDKFNMKFTEASGEQQDEILHMFEDNKVAMTGIDSSAFFNLLLQLTIEGAYSDPLYGGNKNMMGWVMKEFPGPVMGYLEQIEEKEFIKMAPVSLKNYQKFS